MKWLSRELNILFWAGLDIGSSFLASWLLSVDFWQLLLIVVVLTANRALWNSIP